MPSISRTNSHRGLTVILSIAMATALACLKASGEIDAVSQEATAGKTAYLSGDFAGAEQHYSKALAAGDKLPPAAQ